MLLGDSSVGKTCVLVRFKDGAFLGGNFIATVGIDFRVRDAVQQLVEWFIVCKWIFCELGIVWYACYVLVTMTKCLTSGNTTKWCLRSNTRSTCQSAISPIITTFPCRTLHHPAMMALSPISQDHRHLCLRGATGGFINVLADAWPCPSLL